MIPYEKEKYMWLLVQKWIKEENERIRKRKTKDETMTDKNPKLSYYEVPEKMTETKKVNIELEVDTNVVDSSKNKYQSWIDMAFPRCMENIS